jgi:hypothetical protein
MHMSCESTIFKSVLIAANFWTSRLYGITAWFKFHGRIENKYKHIGGARQPLQKNSASHMMWLFSNENSKQGKHKQMTLILWLGVFASNPPFRAHHLTVYMDFIAFHRNTFMKIGFLPHSDDCSDLKSFRAFKTHMWQWPPLKIFYPYSFFLKFSFYFTFSYVK